MNNTNGYIKPDLLVTDFDRTLTYLYKDPSLLPELANRIRTLYGNASNFAESDSDNELDGYIVWHKLHDIAMRELPQTLATEINEQAEDIVADFELQIVKRIGLFPDIPKAIRNLHSSEIRLGVVSSNATSVVRFALEDAGILNEFEYVDGRPHPFNPDLIKPNPYPLIKALNILKVQPDLCWYVGDDVLDMLAANAAHVTAVGVCTGRYSESELIKSGANLVFQSFLNIPNYFRI